MKNNILTNIIRQHKQGASVGVCSVCSAHPNVIHATIRHASANQGYALLETTSNQVNQYGGYIGMTPADFRRLVFSAAETGGLPANRIILGGDHLGPNPWKHENSQAAMKKAGVMVRQFALAGFSKIHLDASMILADDTADSRGALDPGVAAERAAELCQVAEAAFSELQREDPRAIPPVYVIGTEVPVPGGSTEQALNLRVTTPEDFRTTVRLSRKAFESKGLGDAWARVIAVVVQPGVEFGHEEVHAYDRTQAKALSSALGQFEGIVFEGHSTDYQLRRHLRQMVEDGVAILKVGPALTFAFREAIFLLSYMEEELYGDGTSQRSHVRKVLDDVMVKDPEYWQGYYRGNAREVAFARKYSLSDRCRYYWATPAVEKAVQCLLNNLRSTEIPLSLLSQFMPEQYRRVRLGHLANRVDALIEDRIAVVLDDYAFATNPQFEVDHRRAG